MRLTKQVRTNELLDKSKMTAHLVLSIFHNRKLLLSFLNCFLRHFGSRQKLLCLDITCKHLLLTIFRGLPLLHPKCHPKYKSRKHFQN